MAIETAAETLDRIEEIVGEETEDLLGFTCSGVPGKQIHVPGPDFVDRVVAASDRRPGVLVNLQRIFDHGRLAGTGYLSILPVDQGIEHSGASAFAPNPTYFDPESIVNLAIEGGCNAVASTLGVLGAVSRKYAHKIPFILKINHNELLTYPSDYRQTLFGNVEQAFDMGAAAVGATIYWGSEDSARELEEISNVFSAAHELGMVTILWCYLRNSAFKVDGKDYHAAADLTGQANHLGVTIQADIIKQKLPTNNGGYPAIGFGRTDDRVYGELVTDHPIDMVRWQVANCYMGRIGLINSGGASKGKGDLAAAVRTAVINKRGGGMGLISGRKAFQKPMHEGIELLNAIQDVYLCKDVTVACGASRHAGHDEDRLLDEALVLWAQAFLVVVLLDVHDILTACDHIDRDAVVDAAPEHHEPAARVIQHQIQGHVTVGYRNDGIQGIGIAGADQVTEPLVDYVNAATVVVPGRKLPEARGHFVTDPSQLLVTILVGLLALE